MTGSYYVLEGKSAFDANWQLVARGHRREDIMALAIKLAEFGHGALRVRYNSSGPEHAVHWEFLPE